MTKTFVHLALALALAVACKCKRNCKFVSFRFVSFRFVSFRFVSFLSLFPFNLSSPYVSYTIGSGSISLFLCSLDSDSDSDSEFGEPHPSELLKMGEPVHANVKLRCPIQPGGFKTVFAGGSKVEADGEPGWRPFYNVIVEAFVEEDGAYCMDYIFI